MSGAPAGGGPAAARVLIVDDERFYREALREALSQAGIECDSAAEADEALERLREPGFGVVLLDVRLPGTSGIEVLRKLRAEGSAARVVILSAHTEQETVLEALRLGAFDYLAKPFHDEEVVLAVRRARASFALEAELRALRQGLRALAETPAEASRDEAAGAPRALEAAGPGLAEADGALLRALAALRGAPAPAPEPDAAPPAELARGVLSAVADEVAPERVLGEAAARAARGLAAASVALYLACPRTGALLREAAAGEGGADRERLPRDRGLTGRALATGRRVLCEDPSREEGFDPEVDAPAAGPAGPLAVLPLRLRGRSVGVVRVFAAKEPLRDAADTLEVAFSAAARTALLYRSLLEAIDDLARARRESRTAP